MEIRKERARIGSSVGTEGIDLLADRTLDRFPWYLQFPGKLESFYNESTRKERSRYLYAAGYVAIFVYNLFLVSDFFMVRDAFRFALITRLAFGTPLLAVGMAVQRRDPPPVVREVIESVLIFLIGLTLVAIISASDAASSTAYHPGVTLVIIFSNIVVRLRFWYALASSFAVFAAYVAAIPTYYISSSTLEVNNLIFLASAIILSLISNYSLEREMRTNFLHALRERSLSSTLKDQNSRLAVLSNIDPLTNLPNRRALEAFLNGLTRRRTSSNTSVLLLDIDHFKQFNDTYGHQEGDNCLARVASVLRDTMRSENDFVGRYGGEEFIAILQETPGNVAGEVAERIRLGILGQEIPHAGSSFQDIVTISIGVSCGPTAAMDDCRDLIRRADSALYRAKDSGRNRVMIDGA